jgi:NAD(P)-dependent dehydrogenase (short-subunit alcohol dehydrogenase family)
VILRRPGVLADDPGDDRVRRRFEFDRVVGSIVTREAVALGRIGDPAAFGDAVAFLASEPAT